MGEDAEQELEQTPMDATDVPAAKRPHVELPRDEPLESTIERIEAAEQRGAEMHYRVKWRGKGPEHNTWVAESELDVVGLELAASLEVEVAADVACSADASIDDGDGELFFVEALISRRISNKTSRYEYLVRWHGFDCAHDSWEPACGLPADMRAEFDAAFRAGSKRARCGSAEC